VSVSTENERSTRWERKDVSGPAVLRFVVYLSAAALVIHLLVGLFYSGLKAAGESASFPAETPVVQWDHTPKPWLEIAEGPSKAELPVDGYGWVDPQNGIVRIPINRAIELFAREMMTNEIRK
jgi:hypothetical protein